MRLDLFTDLWIERRRRFAFWCMTVMGWNVISGALYPALVDEIWVEQILARFNPLVNLEQGYWLLILAGVGFPILGGGYAFWEGVTLFKGRAVRNSIAFLLAYPLPRWQVFLSRLVYLVSGCFLLTIVTFLSGAGMILLSGNPFPADFLGLLPASFLLILFLGGVGVLLGALSKSFWLDRLAGLLLLFLLYLPYGMNSGTEVIRYSPLYYVVEEWPLTGSTQAENLLVLGGLCVAVWLAGGFAFERLELE